ncbi:hypothetical protein HK097_005498 [Rhizophlyctis rosea]|uniref:Uncharacterized protein n=1 Tax=Rhizophlyctis rosea TaxID=64517 RepID=A0AAD5SF01_9FUNG|nr:hypothetical protein HK097_005498 [Rhizophlyctis rosea]
MQKAVNTSRDPYTGIDTIKWKLVRRTWSNIALDQYCIDPGNRRSGDPVNPECPDVINLGTTQLAGAWANKQLKALDKEFVAFFRKSGRGLRDEFVKYAYYDYYTREAKPMAIPISSDTRILIYSRKIFQRVGLKEPPPSPNVTWASGEWNWLKIVEYAKKIWDAGEGYGFQFRAAYDEETKLFSVISRDPNFNVQLNKVDGQEASWRLPLANRCGWETEGFYRILTDVIAGMWLRDKSGNTDIYNREVVTSYLNISQPDWYGDDLGSPIDQPDMCNSADGCPGFYTINKWGMRWADSSNLASMYASTEGRKLFDDGELGVATMPSKGYLGGTGLAVLNSTLYPERAWEFLEQMVDEKMLLLIGKLTGVPPPYDNVIEDDYWENDRILSVIAQQLKESTPLQYPDIAFPQMAKIEAVHPARHIMTEMLYKGVSPEAAIGRACWAINYLFTPECLAIGSPKTNSSCANYCDLLRNATVRRSFQDLLDHYDEYPQAAISLWSYLITLLVVNTLYAVYLIRRHIGRGRMHPDEMNGKAEEGQEKSVMKSMSSTSITMTIWQARPTTANYLAVAALIGDWIQYSGVLVLIVPEWTEYFQTLTDGIAILGFNLDFSWYYIVILGVFLPLWAVYTVTFWSGMASKLAEKNYGKLFLRPATYILVFCGNFGFIPIVQALLKLSDCRYAPAGITMMDMNCTMPCWQTDHWWIVASSYVILMVFVPLQLTQAHVWQEIQDGLDIKDDQIHVVLSLMIRLFHAIINRFFFNMVWTSIVILLITDTALAIYTWHYNTNNVVWVQKLARAVTMMTLGTAIGSVITHVMGSYMARTTAGGIGTAVLAVLWVIPLAGFAWYVKRRYPPELTLFISGETAGAMERLVQMLPKIGGKGGGGKKEYGQGGASKISELRLTKTNHFPPETQKKLARFLDEHYVAGRLGNQTQLQILRESLRVHNDILYYLVLNLWDRPDQLLRYLRSSDILEAMADQVVRFGSGGNTTDFRRITESHSSTAAMNGRLTDWLGTGSDPKDKDRTMTAGGGGSSTGAGGLYTAGGHSAGGHSDKGPGIEPVLE